MVREVMVYVHGVTPKGSRSHTKDYRALHEGLRRHNAALPPDFCGAEWGWDPTGGRGRSHQLLYKAEEELGGRAMAAVRDDGDFTLNPLRVAVDKFRGLMMYGFADMFYYVSKDGKNAVRYALAKTVLDHLHGLGVDLDGGGDAVSLTLLGHSAGSVAAFDFLFALFYAPRKIEEFIEPAQVRSGPSQDATRAATPAPAAEVAGTVSDLKRLKAMAEAGNLRVRRLFTFGSPVTMTAFRADSLLTILSRDEDGSRSNRVDGAHYGLTRNDPAFGPALAGPRWVNLWDKDDPIAWPVEPLMKQAGAEVADVYVDVSDSVTKVHAAYWTSDRFHREVARRW